MADVEGVDRVKHRIKTLATSPFTPVAMEALNSVTKLTQLNLQHNFLWMVHTCTTVLRQFGYRVDNVTVEPHASTQIWSVADSTVRLTFDTLIHCLDLFCTMESYITIDEPKNGASTWLQLRMLLEAELLVWHSHPDLELRKRSKQLLELLASDAVRAIHTTAATVVPEPLFGAIADSENDGETASWLTMIDKIFVPPLLQQYSGRIAWAYQELRRVWAFHDKGIPPETDAQGQQIAWLRLRMMCMSCFTNDALPISSSTAADYLGAEFDIEEDVSKFIQHVMALLEYRNRSVYYMVVDMLSGIAHSL